MTLIIIIIVDATDFEPGSRTIIFQPNQSMACGEFLIKDDAIPEAPEVFTVTFRPTNLVIPFLSGRPAPVAKVAIIDDDP